MNIVKKFKIVKRFFIHLKNLGFGNALLIIIIAVPLVIWRSKSNNADNYLAEFLGVLFTIYFIDFLNSERNRKQEIKIVDLAIQYMEVYCNNMETLLQRLLSMENIIRPGGNINIFGMSNQEMYEILMHKDFWNSPVEITVSDITYIIERKELFNSIIEYANEGSNKIISHYNNQIDLEVRDFLHIIEKMPEYYLLFNVETFDRPIFKAEYIGSLITMIKGLRAYNTKTSAEL